MSQRTLPIDGDGLLQRLESLSPEAKLTAKVDVLIKQGTETNINQYQVLPETEFSVTGRAQLRLCTKPGSDKKYLMKRFNKSREEDDEGNVIFSLNKEDEHELELAASLRQEFVVDVIEIIDDFQWTNVFMVMEFMEGGQIMKFNKEKKRYMSGNRKRLPNEEIKSIMGNILSALDFCHKKNIVHRDIKPENILLTAPVADGGVAKLMDFGISEKAEPDEDGCLMVKSLHEHDRRLIGTVPFLPKEAFKEPIYDGAKGDIWALGITLLVMLTGKVPVLGNDTQVSQAYEKMDSFKLPRSVRGYGNLQVMGFKGPDPASALASEMLNLNVPQNRPSAEALLQDPFITGGEGLKQ